MFVANEGSNDISAFAVDHTTGALTAVPGSPFAAGTDPKAMALARTTSGEYNLYVANAGSDTVSAYTMDANTGALTPKSPATIATGKGPASIAVISISECLRCEQRGLERHFGLYCGDGRRPDPNARIAISRWRQPAQPGIRGRDGVIFSTRQTPMPRTLAYRASVSTRLPGHCRRSAARHSRLPVSHYMAIEQTGIQAGNGPTSGYLYVTTDASIVGYAIDCDHRYAYAAAGISGCRWREWLFNNHRSQEPVSLCRQRRLRKYFAASHWTS